MSQAYLMGVDIGTFSSKGVLVDAASGEVVASHEIEHDISMPQPGWVEHDADKTWWGEFVAICRQLLASTAIDAKKIMGIGASGIGPCVLPVDAEGNALRPAILYGIDTRSSEEIAILEQELGRETILQISGSNLDSSATGPKILWLKRHEPEVYKKARWFLTSQSYLVLKLTGRATVDAYTSSTYGPFIDIEGIRWIDRTVTGINPSRQLPEILWAYDIAGTVTAEAARQTGLAEGTPVIVGTFDSAAEAISAGVHRLGDMMMMIGSSNSLILKTDRFIRTQNFWGLNFLEPGTFAVVAGMATVGSLTRWFRDNFSPLEIEQQQKGGKNAYVALAELLEASPAGANGLVALPYFKGERTPVFDPQARGVLFGLTLNHTRADVYRALLEAVGFGLRHNIEMIQAEGVRAQRILGIGGGTKNLAWMQIISDIANVSISIPEVQNGASYGDAIMAGVGVGLFKNLSEVASRIRFKATIQPRPEFHQKYSQFYSIYRELYVQTQDLMHRLAQV